MTDVNRISDDSKPPEDSEDSLLLLCTTLLKLFVLLALLGGIVAILSFGIYFLVVDHDKGGSCASGTGRDIWIYFLIKLIIGVFTQCFTTCFAPRGGKKEGNADADTDADAKKQHGDASGSGGGMVTSILFTLLLHVGMLIYGGIVLIHEEVCQSYVNTGLYQMAYALFFLDCSFLFVAVVLGILKNLCLCKAGADAEQALTNKDSIQVQVV